MPRVKGALPQARYDFQVNELSHGKRKGSIGSVHNDGAYVAEASINDLKPNKSLETSHVIDYGQIVPKTVDDVDSPVLRHVLAKQIL
jgi:hypothetical protein